MPVTRLEVLKLYKKLVLYSKSLTLTDPVYFKSKVSAEFKRNRDLIHPKDIRFAYEVNINLRKVRHCCAVDQLSNMLRTVLFFRPQLVTTQVALKHTIDYSKVPKINEIDLSEKFVRGSGPGGSAVNKNANCVVLTHIPTGIVVKCHSSRCQDDNRKTAREMIITKLDAELNGEESVAAQRKRIEEKKSKRSEYKRKKMALLKSEWMKREGL